MSEQLKNVGNSVTRKEENALFAGRMAFVVETRTIQPGTEIVRLEQSKQLEKMATIVYNQNALPVTKMTSQYFFKTLNN